MPLKKAKHGRGLGLQTRVHRFDSGWRLCIYFRTLNLARTTALRPALLAALTAST